MDDMAERMDRFVDTDTCWVKDLEHVFKYGFRASPRGMQIYESIGYRSIVSMKNPIIFNPKRELGYKFMAAEAAWILEGRNDVASISPYSKDISKFSDDGNVFFGAYGPKVSDQYQYVLNTLVKDLDSRQAVITIWRENPGPSKDIPCTVALQFIVRHNTMHCIASMRSSDLWLGHPYDIFNFSAVAFALVLDLNIIRRANDQELIQLGELHLTAGSKHLYERNTDAASRIIEDYYENGLPKFNRSPCFKVEKYEDSQEFIWALWSAANSDMGARSLL